MRQFNITFSTEDLGQSDEGLVHSALEALASDRGIAVSGLTVTSEVPATRTITEAEYQELINRAGR